MLIDFRGVKPSAAYSAVLIAVNGVNNNSCGARLRRHYSRTLCFCCKLHQSMIPPFARVFVDWSGSGRRRRAFLRRIHEGTQPFKTTLNYKLTQPFKLLLRLPRKTGDEIGSYRTPGLARANQVEQRFDPGTDVFLPIARNRSSSICCNGRSK